MLNKSRILNVLFSVIFLSSMGFSQDFSATINAAGGSSEYGLTFGFNPNATDGYDPDYDQYAPPAPPPPAFDAALTWGGDRYYAQILAGDGNLSEHEYAISLAYGSDNLITITWDNTGWSDMMSSCVLQDAFGGLLGIDIDMTQENSLTLDNPAFNTLKLLVTPNDYSPPADPSTISITSPADGAVLESGDVSVEFLVENLVIPDEGHVHLWVDDSMDGMFYTIDPIAVTGLGEGSHTIALQLVDTGHNAFDPDVSSSISVTVELPAGPSSSVFITELADPNNASSARFVELFNIGAEDIDLGSGWALQRWTNGNTDPQGPVALTGTISAGGFYVISPNGTAFESMYGVEADQDIGTGGAADSNGDDNIALVDPDGNIADMYGRPGEDGSGTDHEFEDGRAERNSDIAGGNATFDPSEWAIDNDSGGGDGPQDAPDGFDPFVWFDHDGLPTGNWGCLDPEALNYDSDSDGCEDGTEDCCAYPTLATISEIQGQADASPFAGEYVETSGIVTAVASGSYWIQDGSGAWNGIYVYDPTDTLVSVGDDISIVALVTEYYDLTELTTLVEFTVNSSGNALPDAVSLATGAVSDEAYESVLVATSGTSDSEVNNYGEWTIDDGSGPAILDDMMFAFVPIVGNEYAVTGPLYYGFGAYKIQPRDENDVVDVTPDGGNPDFSVTINVAAGDSITYYDLTVGFSPDATDGYDEGIDLYAPPAPPPRWPRCWRRCPVMGPTA